MIKIKIKENDQNQRLDRFLSKYMDKAPKSFIQKMIRKKRIKLNSKRAYPESMLELNDEVIFYLAEETIDKFRSDIIEIKSDLKLDIVYEDENIILINKKKGDLSHSDKKNERSIANALVKYLIDKNEYNPKKEKSFRPAISNRLDRNTSGIIIGSKNHNTLKAVNEVIKNQKVDKYYKALVYGKIDKKIILKDYIVKDDNENKVNIIEEKGYNSKEIITEINPIRFNDNYSLLDIKLVTGRKHQIRAHLNHINHPILGDRKYNDSFYNKYRLDSQFLFAYKIIFNSFKNHLKYLNGLEFEIDLNSEDEKLISQIFNN